MRVGANMIIDLASLEFFISTFPYSCFFGGDCGQSLAF